MNDPCGPLTWEYDGTSRDALTSQKAVLQKGKVYTIAPMIADAQDHIYDSGIIFGPDKPKIEKLDFLPPAEIKNPDFLPDFSRLNKRDLQKLNWGSVDTEDLSKDQIDTIDWNRVNLKRDQGKRAFRYDDANWDAIIQSDGFGKKAAMSLRTDLLPDHSLTRESMGELLQLGATLSTKMKEQLMM